MILFGITIQAKDNVPIQNLYESVEVALKALKTNFNDFKVEVIWFGFNFFH